MGKKREGEGRRGKEREGEGVCPTQETVRPVTQWATPNNVVGNPPITKDHRNVVGRPNMVAGWRAPFWAEEAVSMVLLVESAGACAINHERNHEDTHLAQS
eukprot:289606-Prymnesium_polylepis.1